MATLLDLLKETVNAEGSDLHLTVNSPPMVRVNGQLQALPYPALTDAESKTLAYSVLTDSQKKRLEQELELDFAFGIRSLGRFRCNVFHQRGSVAAAYRLVPAGIRTFQELGLPPIVQSFAQLPRGLVLVTGPTGSGKSTTLATLIDKINTDRRGHILTIEDPIEFVHEHKGCVVNQRELHLDTRGFASALRAAMREDPDVVLIGELRDIETTEAALRIAETGHLTLATLHTNSASQTINRVLDLFPSHQLDHIRVQLSLVLEGVICQTLLSTTTGQGRALAAEVLVPTNGVRNLIRENKIHQIYSAMQAGQERIGMQTFNQSLAALVSARRITRDIALSVARPRDELEQMLERGIGLPANRVHRPELRTVRA